MRSPEDANVAYAWEGNKLSLEFRIENRATNDNCQRCGMDIGFGSREQETSVMLMAYAKARPEGKQLFFVIGFCSACATWLADRLYACARDSRVTSRRQKKGPGKVIQFEK